VTPTHAGIALRTLAFREDEKDWRVVNETVAKAMTLYAHLAGPYIWPQFTYTEAFCGGGAMEYNMLVMAEPDFKTTMFRWMENTVAHELAPQLVLRDDRIRRARVSMLDEGFAQYFDHRYTDETFPKRHLRIRGRMPWLKGYSMRSRNERDYLEGAWAHDERTLSTPANGQAGYDTYGTSAYSKPASMLHTLRGVLGDSVFTAFLREYYKRNVLKHPMPEDVQAAARRPRAGSLRILPLVGGDFGAAELLSFKQSSKRSADGYTTRLIVERKGTWRSRSRSKPGFRTAPSRRSASLPRRRAQPVEFTSRTKLDRAILDPRHEVIEMDRLDNHVRRVLAGPRCMCGRSSASHLRTSWVSMRTDALVRDRGRRARGRMARRTLSAIHRFPLRHPRLRSGTQLGTGDGSIAYRVGSW
jgi:hypothetical protein